MSISDTMDNLHQVPVDPSSLNLSEFAEKSTGAWPKGWYPAELIPGFDKGGHQFVTETNVSSKGDSFNVMICFRVAKEAGSTEIRTDFTQLNYRPTDFTPDRMQVVRNMREAFSQVTGKWPGGPDVTDVQRSSLALGKIGQFQSASGAPITFLDGGAINVAPFIGRKLFVYYDIEEETGYNKITRFSAYATGVAPKAKKFKKAKGE